MRISPSFGISPFSLLRPYSLSFRRGRELFDPDAELLGSLCWGFLQEDVNEAQRRKELAEDAPIDILSTSPVRSSVALPPTPRKAKSDASGQPQEGEGEEEVGGKRWWWEEEGDGDDKSDWYLPIKLGRNGKVWRDWESLFD